MIFNRNNSPLSAFSTHSDKGLTFENKIARSLYLKGSGPYLSAVSSLTGETV